MGYEIVYCNQCQSQVRGVDLAKGAALRIDGNVYCPKCARGQKKTPSGGPEGSSSPRAPEPVDLMAPRTGGTTRLHREPPPPPVAKTAPAEPPPARQRRRLWIGLGGGALLAVLLLFGLLAGGGGGGRAPEAPSPARASARAPGEPPHDDSQGARALLDLERLDRSKADPVEILLRCQEIKPLVRGARDQGRVRAIEEKAKEAKRARDQERQVEMGFEQVRSIRAMDPRYERREEIERLLKRIAEVPGPRRAQAEQMLAEYTRQAQESRKQFEGMVGWYCFKSAEGLGLDSSGQGHDAYSVSGAFSNKSAPQPGPGIRFDGSGMLTLPLIIREDFSISVWVRTSQVHGGGQHWFEGQGLVDAEVPGVVADFGTALLGSKFAFGVGAPDTTWTSKSAINDGRWQDRKSTRLNSSHRL